MVVPAPRSSSWAPLRARARRPLMRACTWARFRSGQRDGSGKGELSMKPFFAIALWGFLHWVKVSLCLCCMPPWGTKTDLSLHSPVLP